MCSFVMISWLRKYPQISTIFVAQKISTCSDCLPAWSSLLNLFSRLKSLLSLLKSWLSPFKLPIFLLKSLVSPHQDTSSARFFPKKISQRSWLHPSSTDREPGPRRFQLPSRESPRRTWGSPPAAELGGLNDGGINRGYVMDIWWLCDRYLMDIWCVYDGYITNLIG